MRYKELLEHDRINNDIIDSWKDKILDDDYDLKFTFDDYKVYEKIDEYNFICLLVTNIDDNTMGWIVLEPRTTEYYNLRNAKSLKQGVIYKLLLELLNRNYRIISDNHMTESGEKLFLKFQNISKLFVINIKTGEQYKWSSDFNNTELDPRINPSDSTDDKKDSCNIYWLLENMIIKEKENKFGKSIGGSRFNSKVLQQYKIIQDEDVIIK